MVRRSFDIVLVHAHTDKLHCYSIFHNEYFTIPLTFVPVGFHLSYKVDEEEKPLPYEEGTPFKLDKGELILYRKEKKKFVFVNVESQRSQQWPMSVV